MADASTEQLIHDRYPDLYNSFRNIPELWNILIWAAQPNINLSRTQLDAAVQNTQYYKTHTLAQRNWDTLVAIDPASAVQTQKKYQNDTLLASVRLGANLSFGQIGFISQQAVVNNWSAQQLNDAIVGYISGIPEAKRAPGQFSGTMTQIRQIADDYAVPVGDKELTNLAKNFLLGGGTATDNEAALRDVFSKRAQSLYPSLKEELAGGMTVSQWADPYKQLAAKELEVSPDTITFNDPKWRKMIEGATVPGKTSSQPSTKAPLTLSEWQATLRENPIYGYDKTTGARAQASDFETQLLSKFGATG